MEFISIINQLKSLLILTVIILLLCVEDIYSLTVWLQYNRCLQYKQSQMTGDNVHYAMFFDYVPSF